MWGWVLEGILEGELAVDSMESGRAGGEERFLRSRVSGLE